MKAKNCPFCSTQLNLCEHELAGWHPESDCPLSNRCISLAQWNRRPREEALEKAIKGVKEKLDSAVAAIKKDSNDCAADAENLKAKGDKASSYVIGTQSMAHELDLKRLAPALATINAALKEGGE